MKNKDVLGLVWFGILFSMVIGFVVGFGQCDPIRLGQFLPSIIVIGAVGLVGKIYSQVMGFYYGDQCTNQSWIQDNRKFVLGVIVLPTFVTMSFFSVFLYCSWLVLIFPVMTGQAWLAVVLSGMLSLVRFFFDQSEVGRLIPKSSEVKLSSPVLEGEVQNTETTKFRFPTWVKTMFSVSFSFVITCCVSWLCIFYQSLWVGVLAELMVLMVFPAFIVLLTVVIAFLALLCWIYDWFDDRYFWYKLDRNLRSCSSRRRDRNNTNMVAPDDLHFKSKF